MPAQAFSHALLSVTPQTIVHQASLSMGFSQQEYHFWLYHLWLPSPPPGDLLDLGIEPESPALVGGFFTTEPPWGWISDLPKDKGLFMFSHCCCCCCSVAQHVGYFVTQWTAAHQASLSFTISWSLLKFVSIELMMPINHLTLRCPLLLPSIFPSIRVFSNESALRIRWPKFWCFSFSISPPNEYSGLISFRIDWFNLLAVQGTLKSLLQHHSLKASIL